MSSEQLLLFEEPKTVPNDGLENPPFPQDFREAYHPTTNRIVIEYTDAQKPELMRRLGVAELDRVCYTMEEILHG